MQKTQRHEGAWRDALAQGLRGHHPLFEDTLVRFTMRREDAPKLSPAARQRLRLVQKMLEDTVDPHEGREWVQGAPLEVQEILIRAYFESLFDYLETQPFLAN